MGLFIQLTLYALIALSITSVVIKTGHNPVLAILAFIPLLNLIFFLYLAFTKWPIEEQVGELHVEIDRLKDQLGDRCAGTER